jgi:DnaK suppressor protein
MTVTFRSCPIRVLPTLSPPTRRGVTLTLSDWSRFSDRKESTLRAEELTKLRTLLNHRRRAVLETAARADAELDGLRDATASAELEEGAQVLTGADAVERLGNAERLELRRIDAALARIDQGSYGACADCGEEIEPRRLAALPHAVRCQDCEEARERVTAR